MFTLKSDPANPAALDYLDIGFQSWKCQSVL